MGGEEFQGITRFHKATISAGVVFCLAVAWRFVLSYQSSGSPRYMFFAGCALGAAIFLIFYLRSFIKRGI